MTGGTRSCFRRAISSDTRSLLLGVRLRGLSAKRFDQRFVDRQVLHLIGASATLLDVLGQRSASGSGSSPRRRRSYCCASGQVTRSGTTDSCCKETGIEDVAIEYSRMMGSFTRKSLPARGAGKELLCWHAAGNELVRILFSPAILAVRGGARGHESERREPPLRVSPNSAATSAGERPHTTYCPARLPGGRLKIGLHHLQGAADQVRTAMLGLPQRAHGLVTGRRVRRSTPMISSSPPAPRFSRRRFSVTVRNQPRKVACAVRR